MGYKSIHYQFRFNLFALVCIGSLFMIFERPAHAADSVCAVVKIEINQELTLERQAFDANMKISNDLDLLPLNDVTINVNFTDADGNPVIATSDPNDTSASFFIRIDSLTGVDSINGGTIASETQADIHWLIIPAPGGFCWQSCGGFVFRWCRPFIHRRRKT